jgi:hypothetical protein
MWSCSTVFSTKRTI